MWPPHSVAIQLKIFTAVGIAINIVPSEKAVSAIGPSPVVNMWWLQTPNPRNAMAIPEKITNGAPNSGLRENVGRISDTTPNDGRIRM